METRICTHCHYKIFNYTKFNISCPVCYPNRKTKNYKKKKCIVCDSRFVVSIGTKKTCSEECKKKTLPKSCHLGEFYHIKVRDNFTCIRCKIKIMPNGTRYRLHAHHKRPKRFGGSNKDENIICLCTGCHTHIHNCTNKNKEFIDIPMHN